MSLQYLSYLIKEAPSDEARFARYLVRNLTPERFLVHLFGNDLLLSFYESLAGHQRNFLIALDGFDSNFQKFRQETLRSYHERSASSERTRFEQDWLSGLISAVRRYKQPRGTAPLVGKIDFCVTIPKDRFIEFTENDRDAFEWEGKKVDISWTGIELSILLRKR